MAEVRKTKAYFRRLAATRGVRWKRVEREYFHWRDQERADRLQDERLRRAVWNHYRGDRPEHAWRNGLQRLFRHEFTDGDHTTIKDWDTLARDLAYEYPALIGAPPDYDERRDFEPDWSAALFEYIKRPPLKRPPIDEVIERIIDEHAQSTHKPDVSFDVDDIEAETDRLDLPRLTATDSTKPRQLPPAAGFVEFATNIAALCLDYKQATDPANGGTAEQREGSCFVQLTPTEDAGRVYATATNGRAAALVQCTGQLDRSRLCPATVAPKSGAKADRPVTAAIDRDRWTNSKGVQAGRVADGLVEFPGLRVGVDNRAEPFCVDIDDLVKLAKALGTKRLGFYPAPGDPNEGEPKLIAVLPMDPESAVGAGMLVHQPCHMPTAQEFADALDHMLGIDREADEPDLSQHALPATESRQPFDESEDEAWEAFLASL